VSELSEALNAVVDGLTRLEIDYIVVGSVAAASWGVVRSTRDVDIVAIIDSSSIDRFLDGLEGSGLYVPSDHARTVASNGGSFNVVHTVSGGKVDVFVPPRGDAFTASRLARRQPANVLGIDVYVASAEDVLLAKLRWRLVTRSDVQWRDCVEIAATNELDQTYLDRWAGQLGVEKDLADLLDQVRTESD
jgi:hypothetical protein